MKVPVRQSNDDVSLAHGLSLTFIVACKGRLRFLMQSLPTLTSMENIAVVLVDYNCPEHSGRWVANAFPLVKVVSVTDSDGFNRGRALNVGAEHANTSWLCFTDADVIWSPGASSEVWPLLKENAFLRIDEYRDGLCGTFFCQKGAFSRVGGFDDTLAGWGFEDEDLYGRFQKVGMKAESFSSKLVRHIPHPASIRNEYLADVDAKRTWLVNFIYVQFREALSALVSEAYVRPLRSKLHDVIRSHPSVPAVLLETARNNGEPVRAEVELDLRAFFGVNNPPMGLRPTLTLPFDFRAI